MEKTEKKKLGQLVKDEFGQMVFEVNAEKLLIQFMVQDTRANSEAEENWPDLKLLLNSRNAETGKW